MKRVQTLVGVVGVDQNVLIYQQGLDGKKVLVGVDPRKGTGRSLALCSLTGPFIVQRFSHSTHLPKYTPTNTYNNNNLTLKIDLKRRCSQGCGLVWTSTGVEGCGYGQN